MDKCNSKQLLRSHNIKATKQRLLIMDNIIEMQSIFTANSLFKYFSSEMDLVTVYRILNTLKEKKIIREIFGTNDPQQYELACIHNPIHPHFHCRECNKLYCLEAVDRSLLLNLENNLIDLIVEDISIQFTGICKTCRC